VLFFGPAFFLPYTISVMIRPHGMAGLKNKTRPTSRGLAGPQNKTRPTLCLIAACGIFAAALSGQTPAPIDPCASARDLRLTNGKFVTMDARGSTVSEVTIQNGKFTAVGPRSGQRLSPCTREINLRGRTVVPGLIDNHNHIVLLGIRPGYHTPLESATSIAEVQAAIKERAKSVPAGQFITSMGGWNPLQFAEKRLPTLAELDAATSDHPVLVFLSFTGPAAMNTRGKAFLPSGRSWSATLARLRRTRRRSRR